MCQFTSINIAFVAFFVIAIGLGVGIGYRARRREVGSKAAGRDIRRGVLIIGVFVIIFIGLFRLLPSYWGIHALYLTVIVAYWAYFLSWLRRKGQAGSVLLDLGRTKLHKKTKNLGLCACYWVSFGSFLHSYNLP